MGRLQTHIRNKLVAGALAAVPVAVTNPTSGRLQFVPSNRCIKLDLRPQEALKLLISGGNYMPPAIGAATMSGYRF